MKLTSVCIVLLLLCTGTSKVLGTAKLSAVAAKAASPPIGFSAYAKISKSYAPWQRILFGGVHYRYPSSSYCTSCSSWRCPVSGYYMFMVHLYSTCLRRGGQVCGSIMVNGVKKAEAYSRNIGTSCIYVQASSSVITYCSRGHFVVVQNRCGSNYVKATQFRSTFTGHLLKA